MKKVVLALVLVCGLVSMAQAEAPKYCVGIEMGGEEVFDFSYNACPLEKDGTLEKMRKGTLDKTTLDSLNGGEEFGKLATIETKKGLIMGDIQVPAGKYTAGFNADEKGAIYFVVWVGAEAKKTKIEIKDHQNVTIPNLTFMLGPDENGADNLVALYGKSYSVIPVKFGEVKAEAAPAKVEEKKADAAPAKVEEKKADEKKTEEAKKDEKKGDDTGEDADSWDDLNTHSFSGR